MRISKKRLREIIKKFRLIDDEFMSLCFDNNIECTELMLRIILNKPDIKVTKVKTQASIKNLLGRDVRLDIDAIDSENRKYNIEVQRSDKGADRKRARYHSSILDSKLLKPGDDFSDLPETYVIFLTEHDVIGRGKPLYHVERRIQDIDEPFNDGEYIIYVNGSDRNSETELGKLMQDFFCENPDEMNFKPMADTTRLFKETQEEEKEEMTSIRDYIREQWGAELDAAAEEKVEKAIKKLLEETAKKVAIERALEEVTKKAAEEISKRKSIEIARTLIRGGELSLKKIAAYLDLPLKQVRLMAKEIKANEKLISN